MCDDDCTLVRVDLTLKVNVTVNPVSISLSKTDPAVPLILSHLPYFEGSRVWAKKKKRKSKGNQPQVGLSHVYTHTGITWIRVRVNAM